MMDDRVTKQGQDTKATTTHLGPTIVRLRREHGWSQTELGRRIGPGVAQADVSRYETGAVVPTTARLIEIAEALGVGVTVLLGGSDA